MQPGVSTIETERKYMTQALVRESIARIEDAARTDEDFDELIIEWNNLDKKVQEAYEKTVWSTDSDKFNWYLFSASKGQKDIMYTFFHCICQMHNLIEDDDLARLFEKATDKQKEVFFLRFMRGCKPQKIAECLGVTDRNVRDLTNKMTDNIRKGFYIVLKKRQAEDKPLLTYQTEFLQEIEAGGGGKDSDTGKASKAKKAKEVVRS
jgi:DNA-directed RNA polymerase specialized sigma24 family protein